MSFKKNLPECQNLKSIKYSKFKDKIPVQVLCAISSVISSPIVNSLCWFHSQTHGSFLLWLSQLIKSMSYLFVFCIVWFSDVTFTSCLGSFVRILSEPLTVSYYQLIFFIVTLLNSSYVYFCIYMHWECVLHVFCNDLFYSSNLIWINGTCWCVAHSEQIIGLNF